MTITATQQIKAADRLACGVEVLFDAAYQHGLLPQADFVGPMLRHKKELRDRREQHARLRPDAKAPNLRFDVLIIGSGYGGSVMAARLGSTGKRVAILERGREYLPGEFPASVAELPKHVRIDREGSDSIIGPPEALFDVRSGEDMSVVVGNALGGTSQINAGVVIEPKFDVFDIGEKSNGKAPQWPREIRAAAAMQRNTGRPDVAASLRDAYDRAKKMLGAQAHPAPATLDKYKTLERLNAALKRSRTGGDSEPACKPLDLAINFAAGTQVNANGVAQTQCKNCGNCVSGCNYWAKNTLTMNYLPLAHRFGVELYAGARVVAIEDSKRRTKEGTDEWSRARGTARWIVHVQRTADEGNERAAPRLEVYADVVILAAGALGSTEILLRSRNRGYIRCSDKLGKRFSGNGDMLALGYRQSAVATGIGRSHAAVEHGGVSLPGPTAVGLIDLRDGSNERFIIEDGAIPYPLEWIFREITATSGLIAQLTSWSLRTAGARGRTDPLAADRQSAEHTMTYLLMGREYGSGSLHLEEEKGTASISKRVDPDVQEDQFCEPTRLTVRWPRVGREPLFHLQRIRLEKAFACDADLGVFLPSPAWKPIPESVSPLLSGEVPPGPVTTVHPLGGCPMGETRDYGVVDHAGQVFDGDDARVDATYGGLYVADGSIIPTSLGANPLLTITALAERAAVIIAQRESCGTIRLSPPADAGPLPAPYASERHRPAVAVSAEEPVRIVLKEVLCEEWGGPLARELAARCNVALQGKEAKRIRLVLDIELHTSPSNKNFEDWLESLDRDADVKGFARLEHAVNDTDAPTPIGNEFKVEGKFTFLSDHLGRAAVAGRWKSSHRAVAKRWVRALRYIAVLYALLRARLGREITQAIYVGLQRLCGSEEPQLVHNRGSMSRTWGRVRALLPHLAHMSAPRYMRYELKLKRPGEESTAHLSGEKIVIFRNWRSVDEDPDRLPGSPWLQLGELPLALSVDSVAKPTLGRVCLDIRKVGEERLPQIESISAIHGYQALASFALLFFRTVLERHVLSFKAPTYPSQNSQRPRLTRRLLGLESPEHHWITVTAEPREIGGEATPPLTRTKFFSGDLPQQRSARILLTRYRAPQNQQGPYERREPLLFIHGFLHSGLVFAGDLKPGKNAVQYFCEQGFDVWVLELRTSTLLDTAAVQWTYDDVALGDIPSAVDYVLAQTGYDQLSVIAHCMGAAAFSMAALDGRLEKTFQAPGSSRRSKVRCAVLSQVGPLIEPTAANAARAKAATFVRDWLNAPTVDVAPDDSVTWRETMADRFAYSFPVPESHRRHHRDNWFIPRIDLPVCNRLAMIIGRNWQHENLAKETHRRMYEVLGEGNLTSLLQMAKFMARGLVTDQLGENWYCIDALAHRHLDFPIMLFSGKHNDLFHPDTTLRSYEWLRRVNANTPYKRKLYSRYCHLDAWMGEHADRDIWGDIAKFLQTDSKATQTVQPSATQSPTPSGLSRTEISTPDVVILGWTRYENDKLLARIYTQVPEFITSTAQAGLTSVDGDVRAHMLREGILAPWFIADVPVGTRSGGVAKAISVGTWNPPLGKEPRDVARRLLMRPAQDRKAKTGPPKPGVTLTDGVDIRISQSLANALAQHDEISFFVGSCRWPGSLFEQESSDSIFGSMSAELNRVERENLPYPSFLLLVGDQVYMDATAELLDTDNVRERFRNYYEQAFGFEGSPCFATLARRLPVYMAMDDHEIANDWSRSRLADASERLRWRIARIGFRQYQWSHSPGAALRCALHQPPDLPFTLVPRFERDYTARSAGKFPMWYTFTSSGFEFFVMDTRSERDARHQRPMNGAGAELISGKQREALESWLQTSAARDPERPIFIVSACVLFPMSLEIGRHPANAYREDGWHGYPETRDWLLRTILRHGLQNVVFVAGDVHCAVSAQACIRDGAGKKVRVHCITASALYAPLPFANAKPDDFASHGTLSIGQNCNVDYRVISREFVTCRNFTQVLVRKQETGGWHIESQVHDELHQGPVSTLVL